MLVLEGSHLIWTDPRNPLTVQFSSLAGSTPPVVATATGDYHSIQVTVPSALAPGDYDVQILQPQSSASVPVTSIPFKVTR